VFLGDLMTNGNIKWQETKQSFTTPSGWVNHCKKTMTAETINKTVSAWSVIKYRGKRLDSYKLRWYRMKKKSLAEQSSNSMATQNAIASSFHSSTVSNGLSGTFSNGINAASMNAANLLLDRSVKSNTELLNSINPGLAALYNEATKSQLSCDEDPNLLRQLNVTEHSELPKKYVFNESDIKYLSCNQLVRAVPFRSLDRIQPFTISVSTNALLLMDYHCHLTSSEVVGYLAGSWDIGNHMLNIVQAFPCKVKLGDESQAKIVEEEVKEQLRQRSLSLVGWYHNHGDKAVHPSVKDIECQLEYQVTMKGNECDLAYIPCVGFICSPYFEHNQDGLAYFLAYWVMPPSELTSLEYGKPMQMFYQVSRDCFLTQDLLLEMVRQDRQHNN
jgi:proteasome lid subunit RPN8/RPN11